MYFVSIKRIYRDLKLRMILECHLAIIMIMVRDMPSTDKMSAKDKKDSPWWYGAAGKNPHELYMQLAETVHGSMTHILTVSASLTVLLFARNLN